MKFYFCEACGVRVTDADVSDGLARDKKLKGVYCRHCAIGVTTMETLPIKEGEARQLLDGPQSKATHPAPKGAVRNRRTSAARIPAPARPGRPARRDSDGTIARPSGFPMSAVVGGLIAAIFAAFLLWAMIPTRQIKTKTRPASQVRKAQSSNNDARDEREKRGGRTPAPNSRARSVDRPTGDPVRPQVDRRDEEPSVRPEEPREDPQSPAKSPPSASADQEEEPPTKQPQKTDEQARLAAAKAAEDLARAKQALREMEARSVLAQVRGKLADVFRSGRLVPARAVLAEAEKQRDLSPGAAAGLKRERADLEALLELRDQTFALLKNSPGRKVELARGSLVFEGKVQPGREKGVISLKHPEGAMLQFRLDDFKLKDVARYAPVPKDAEGLRRRGLLHLALAQREQAEKCFTKARDAGLGEAITPYLERVSRPALGADERAARHLWLEAEVEFLSRRWKEALSRYDELHEKHANADFVIENRETLRKRRQHINSIINPRRPGLYTVFYNAMECTPGKAVLNRVDANVNFNLGFGSPDPKIGVDYWAVSWTGFIEIAEAGRYTFKMRSDDGHLMWIDGVLRFDAWGPHNVTSVVTLELNPGLHPIRVEYLECGSTAYCSLRWSLEGGFREQVIPPEVFFHNPRKGQNHKRKRDSKLVENLKQGILGEYFRDGSLARRSLVVRRLDAKIDHNWLQQPPDPRLARGFGARWRGYLKIPKTQSYTFTCVAERHAEVWIGGKHLARSVGQGQGFHLDAGMQSLLVVLYSFRSGTARCSLRWKPDGEEEMLPIPEDVFFHDSRLTKDE